MSRLPPPLNIAPPLINTANPAATTLDDLRGLYTCRSTGAVTTRTSLIQGFDHNPQFHQYTVFDPHHTENNNQSTATLNSLGYSPHTLSTYLGFIKTISDELPEKCSKSFIVSVTGTPEDTAACYKLIACTARQVNFPLAMEVNLSCPNIPSRPPPAYSEDALTTYLEHITKAITDAGNDTPRIPVGLKTPPYTYATQYHGLISALERSASAVEGGVCPISFVAATNTLGSCLVLDAATSQPALPGVGLGGMAGTPLHPLALGNVSTIRRMLDERPEKLGHVQVIGIGGVMDAAGYTRMRVAGADVVGLASGLLLKGVGVFGEIEESLEGRW
ncbi:hypothetical protein VTI74DRAFT_329 [Chaetomium olivicolor]